MSLVKIHTLMSFLMSISIAGFCQGHTPVNNHFVKCIKIKYVDIDIETPINVNCGDFENYFGGQIKMKKIIKKRQIDKMINRINKFLRSARRYDQPCDVRIKILIEMSNGSEQTFCMGRLTSSFNGINYINDKKIIPKILNALKL